METFERGLTMLIFTWGLLALFHKYSHRSAGTVKVKSKYALAEKALVPSQV